MVQSPAATRPLPLLRRLGGRFMSLDVRNIGNIKIEDMALSGGYFAIFWLLEAVNLTAFGSLKVEAFASAWPAIAVLGCAGVLFRRTSPTAMAWMCGTAAVGLLLAGQAGAFLLMFELFFSLVLFGTARASALASHAAWVLSALSVAGAFALFRDAGIAVAAGFIAVLTLLTPAEWAGNLRKANQLADSESARADAVQEASRQRLLAERNAHDLALEHERAHLARELHDVISARLCAIALQSGAALHGAPEGSGRVLLHQIRGESVAGLEELNTMIRLLHTREVSESPGRLADLESLTESRRAAGLEVHLDNAMDDGGHHLPLSVQTAVYRIVSESLINAAKHAPGQPVDISLAASGPGEELVVSVRNLLPSDPSGAPTGTGTGIPSMHFRATHAGGMLTTGPEEEHWVVRLRLPHQPQDSTDPNEGARA